MGLREELEAVGIRVTRMELISGVIPVAYAEGDAADAPSTAELT